MRLHELSKELNADSKRLLAIAKELGLPGIKSASSNVEAGVVGILKAAWAEELAELAEKAERKAAKAAAAIAEEQAAAAAAAAPPPVEADVAVPEEVPATQETAASVELPAAAVPEADVVEAPAAADSQVEVPATPEAEAAADAGEAPRKVLVTIGGHVAMPAEAEELAVTRADRALDDPDAGGDGEADAGADGVAPATSTTETSGPTRRRGARILGRIELKPADLGRHRATQPGGGGSPGFDPADPTLPPTGRRGVGPGGGPGGVAARRGGAETEAPKRGKGGATKPGGIEWVFDPEDNTTLAAIRIGHFAGQRRPTSRRPPMRRSSMPGGRKPRRFVERPTHGIDVRPPVAVRDLSELLGVKTREILEGLADFDPRDKNAVLTAEHLIEVAVKLNREINILDAETEEDRLFADEEKRADELAGTPRPRPPVVAVMGHVDHGKTSLLDALRSTRLAAKEAGGITQRSAAYHVTTKSGASVTFLDTPGHKAFTEMRARGAELTDVAVLVVAADDGVMEQTVEAIEHARAAEVPMVVAINKIDKPAANPRKVRQELSGHGILVEDYGGEIGVVECSAITGQGLDALVERLALETEILELTADPAIPARGVVVDSRRDSKLGIVATVVIKDGTLRAKDAILAGTAVGRVRFLLDDRGGRIDEAGPSMPVQVLGFEEPPEAGAQLLAVADINRARLVAQERAQATRDEGAEAPASDTVTLENLFDTIAARKVTEVNVVLKADAQGTLAVLRATVEQIQHPEVRFKVIRAGIGAVTEDDVLLASAGKSMIIGFAVNANPNARVELQRTGVSFKTYDVIYEVTEDLEQALEGQLGTEKLETITGHATIREIFRSSRLGNIAGCYVTDGTLSKDSRIRLVRDGRILWTGRLDSLKRFKDDVKEVRENYECGLHLAGYDDIRQGDVLEAFDVTEVRRTLASGAAT